MEGLRTSSSTHTFDTPGFHEDELSFAMAAPRSPHQAEWQSTRVPKLSYRKPIPPEELEKVNYAPREYAPQPKAVARTVSVRETNDGPAGLNLSQAPPRKKSSILSGFFSKEPTISALAQVEADLTAKHGAATSHTVPHVSSRRMPEHVPKVNSRWDGIPETIKMREREDKQRKRLSQTGTFVSPQHHLRSRSSDESIHDTQQSQSRRGSDTASHTDSWPSRTDASARPFRQESFSSATSSSASLEARRGQPASVKPQSLKSPSGSSLPEITSFFPHHQPQNANQISKNQKNVRKQPIRTATTRSDGTSIEAIPEHSSSPVATPREKSPATPIYCDDKEVVSAQMASKMANKRTNARVKNVPMDAFLAGEAKPVEFDDDDDDDDDSSTNTTFRTELPVRQVQQKDRVKTNRPEVKHASRDRDGRNGQVNRIEAAPWEAQQPKISKHAPAAISKNRIPKGLSAFK